ncbi:hypothetical protein D047_2496A, partial [Vibrio parahaemolyticus VPTS-2010_2]
MLCFDKRN